MFLQEFSQGLILPTKDAASSKSITSPNNNNTVSSAIKSPPSETKKTETNGTKHLLKKLTLNEEFKCRVEELYNIFTDINVRS